ncbi:MAG: acetyl-CoA carboxylase carboxyltransferase subunit alpha/beta [Actinomycetota bacterium]|nr:acetyl-CoA carboxylase carboxyltransferase subunit alpha/beta [Actinomycetota bacterium]
MSTTSAQVLAALLDGGSFTAWGSPVQPQAEGQYVLELAAARARSGVEEAVVTGEARLHGRRVAVVVGEFSFLAGSIGLAASRLLVDCITRATEQGLPLLAAPVSGGTRMQEGTPAFVQMATVTGALAEHRRAGLPYLVWLRDPTFGGVFASWGALGHVTWAEPGARIGFLGSRVYAALHGEEFPPGVQTAENLCAHGILDGVLGVEQVREAAARVLDVLCASPTGAGAGGSVEADADGVAGAWECVLRTRRHDRPGVRDVLRRAGVEVTELSGTGRGDVAPATLLGLARIGGLPCVLVAQDRAGQTPDRPLGPADLRVARRGFALAGELGLPLVTVVDTAGAALSQAAEEGALGPEIAGCLFDLAATPVPTLAVLLGQGTGGAALALLTADRVVGARYCWLAPLPPEGASAIVHRTTERAAELAEAQGVGSADLLRTGVVDRLVEERPDAAEEPDDFSCRLLAVVAEELADLVALDPQERLQRRRRPRGIGSRSVLA